MGIRNIEFVNSEYYHVFNRGVDKRSIFTTQAQQYFFFRRLFLLNSTNTSKIIANQRSKRKDKEIVASGDQLVSIVAYCLLPNHFHLLLRQNVDQGISKFMQRLGTSYTKFFNQEESRSGSLFQGKFKATHLSGNFALPTVSAYVNLNYKHHKIDPKNQLVKTSLFEYFNNELSDSICDQSEVNAIIAESGGLEDYKSFIKNASISFANNKGNIINMNDFEF
jgi:REP element-mobilizing transposase RayT